MCQSKVRAENVQHARDLLVNHLGCDIWDMRKSVFYPKEYSQFHCLNLHISLYRLFIAFIQCILSSEWSWNCYCSSVCSCPQHVVKWPCGQVGLKQLFMLSRGDHFDSVMIQSNCGELLGTKSRSNRFVLYTRGVARGGPGVPVTPPW